MDFDREIHHAELVVVVPSEVVDAPLHLTLMTMVSLACDALVSLYRLHRCHTVTENQLVSMTFYERDHYAIHQLLPNYLSRQCVCTENEKRKIILKSKIGNLSFRTNQIDFTT